MRSWAIDLPHDPVAALLDSDDPAVAYFVARDLDGQAAAPVGEIWSSEPVQRLLRGQRGDGSWRGPTAKQPTYPENHSDLLETFKRVRLLVERYELTTVHPAMGPAGEYLLSFQSEEGDLRGFIGNQYATYYTGYVLALLTCAGYAKDPRVEAGLEWLLAMRQNDGGWTIPILTHRFDRETGYRLTTTPVEPVAPERSKPFSHNWTDMVLRAFAAQPHCVEHPAVQHAAELLKSQFFCPDAYGSYRHPRYWTRFGFWWPNLLTAMEVLTALGYSRDDYDMEQGRKWFIANQAPDGLWFINNDGKADRDTPLVRERRSWLGLRICRLLARLS